MTVPAPASTIARTIATWLRQHVEQSGASGLAVGLSGGIDSAVVLGLASLATPDAVLGVVMPCHSTPEDEVDARAVAEHFGVPVARVDLARAYDTLTSDLQTCHESLAGGAATNQDMRSRLSLANVKPRLRMTTLYYMANVLGYLVAGTGNRSELAIGYYTKYGDGGVDLLPLGRLLKSQVRAAARDLGVPTAVIDKSPSAGLWPGQTDEKEMGFGYGELEVYLTQGPGTLSSATAERIRVLIAQSGHKRAMAPMPDLAE